MHANPPAEGRTTVGPAPAAPGEVRELLLRYSRPVVATLWVAALVGLSLLALWCAGLTLLSLFDADHVFETEMDTRLRIFGERLPVFTGPTGSWNVIVARLTSMDTCLLGVSRGTLELSLLRGWFALRYHENWSALGWSAGSVNVAYASPLRPETRLAVPGVRWVSRPGRAKGLAVSCWLVGLVAAALAMTLARWRPRFGRLVRGACVACGYDLTGNVSGRCPECGTVAAAP